MGDELGRFTQLFGVTVNYSKNAFAMRVFLFFVLGGEAFLFLPLLLLKDLLQFSSLGGRAKPAFLLLCLVTDSWLKQ